MELLTNFFQGYSAADLINMAVVAILFGVPNFGVTIVNYFKNILGLSKKNAQVFFLACITITTIGVMSITGQITEVEFTFKNFVAVFTAALVPAKFAYKRFMGRN